MEPEVVLLEWGRRAAILLMIPGAAWFALRGRRALIPLLGRMGLIDRERSPHAEALLLTATRWLILIAAALAALSVAGADLAKVLTAASIAGLALGMGAQNVVRDILAGLFIMMEDQYRPGDYVQINGEMEGLVEALTLRVTRVRGWDGTLLNIGNASVTRVRNYNRDAMRVIIECSVPFEEDHPRVRQVIERLCAEVAQTHRDHFLAEHGVLVEPPFLYGVVNIDSGKGVGATYCIMAMTRVESYWHIMRELRRLLLERFRAEGLRFSYPQRIFHGP